MNREFNQRDRKYYQTEILGSKNTITELKNSIKFNSKLEQMEEKISVIKDWAVKLDQSE